MGRRKDSFARWKMTFRHILQTPVSQCHSGVMSYAQHPTFIVDSLCLHYLMERHHTKPCTARYRTYPTYADEGANALSLYPLNFIQSLALDVLRLYLSDTRKDEKDSLYMIFLGSTTSPEMLSSTRIHLVGSVPNRPTIPSKSNTQEHDPEPHPTCTIKLTPKMASLDKNAHASHILPRLQSDEVTAAFATLFLAKTITTDSDNSRASEAIVSSHPLTMLSYQTSHTPTTCP